jgi:multiple antibiotic resistance protein
MLIWSDYTRFAISLFAILTPFAAVPIFIRLTDGLSPQQKNRAGMIATLTVAIVLILSALCGQAVLSLLGTSLAAFQVGGGLVLILLALSMLKAEMSSVQHRPEESLEIDRSSSVGIVPIGIPLLAGPGAVSTVIIEMNHSNTIAHGAMVIACIVAVCGANWAILRVAEQLRRTLGQVGLNIMSRLFGLILASIAVQIIAAGLRVLLPGLGGAQSL